MRYLLSLALLVTACTRANPDAHRGNGGTAAAAALPAAAAAAAAAAAVAVGGGPSTVGPVDARATWRTAARHAHARGRRLRRHELQGRPGLLRQQHRGRTASPPTAAAPTARSSPATAPRTATAPRADLLPASSRAAGRQRQQAHRLGLPVRHRLSPARRPLCHALSDCPATGGYVGCCAITTAPHPSLQQDSRACESRPVWRCCSPPAARSAATSGSDLGSTTGVPCADLQCAPCADQFCDTADYGKSGSCRAHVAATHQSFGCDGPEDCVAQGVFGACCLFDGIGAACSTAGCGGNARFMCHEDAGLRAGRALLRVGVGVRPTAPARRAAERATAPSGAA